MKAEKSLLQGVVGTAKQQQESNLKKFIRRAFAVIAMLGFLAVIVAAAIRKFGS